ncbi:MAG: SprT-like domain-containing protein [Arachidicoccus sp.]|nr:SprT-like domain-containing protein [Arachidicoccus sp.]
MAKPVRHPLQELAGFLPDNTFDDVVAYLQKYSVHLTVTQHRSSVLGDYRNALPGQNHRISVNGNLNKYSFLITLLHELAHLLTYEKYKHKVAPHGREWKSIYGELLFIFLQKNIFPNDIAKSLQKSLHNPGASTCAEEDLMRVLKKYNETIDPDIVHVEQIVLNGYFKTRDGRIFIRGEKRRTRYFCTEVGTNKQYLFSALYEVKKTEISL